MATVPRTVNYAPTPPPPWTAYPADLRTTINTTRLVADQYLIGGLGPRYDYPNPVWKHYPIDLRTCLWNGLESTLGPQKPFIPNDTSYHPHYTASYPINLRTHTFWYTPVVPVPFKPIEYPNPVARVYPLDLRTFIKVQQIVPTQPPFVPIDTSAVVKMNYPPDLRSWTDNASGVRISVVLPFRQNEWPNPIAAQYSNDFRTWIRTANISGTPFQQTEWPLPLAAVYPGDLRTFLQKAQTIPGPGPAPFRLTEWPNPVLRFYPFDLYTLINNGYHVVPVFLDALPGEIFVVDGDQDFQLDNESDFTVSF